MKKIWLILAAVIVLAIGGVSVYISMIDWNQHKDKIAAQFNDITGKRVVFEGPVSFTLLPSPKLTATDIKVFNPDGTPEAEKPLATIKSLIANLALGPLLQGNFEVQMMSLVEPEMWVKVMPEGKLNWQTPMTDEQRSNLENVEVALDSVILEKAKVNFEDEKHGVNTQLDNLNGEVIAESVFGPYRIEGSYVKGRNPEGFAISLGQFSESFATSVNFVLNQPASQSYLRFDGTVLLKNDAISGNMIVESKKFKEFFDSTFPNQVLDEDLDYPLAMSMELETSKTKINMSNIVVKFGTSAGAGNILVPLFENEFAIDGSEPEERRRIEMAFNMTDLDLTPWVALLKKAAAAQSAPEAVYEPAFDFDVLADLKAIKTTYNNQGIRDFVFSADYVNNSFNIRELSGVFPGETQARVQGDIFENDEKLTYNLETELSCNDTLKFMSWLGYEITPVAQSTYRRMSGKADVSGTLNNIKISPLDVTLDKTVVKGEAGIVRGERPQYFLSLTSDSINFDNYLPGLPKELTDKPFKERLAYRFGQLAGLNDFDVDFRGMLDLGIYENTPFENTEVSLKTAKGVMDISKLSIGGIANAAVSAEGQVSGFGKEPQVTNLKYSIETKNLDSFMNKFELPKPNVDLNDMQQFKSQGIVTGGMDKAAVNTVSKLGNIDLSYSGRISNNEEGYLLNGELELKAPDFVKLANVLNFNYHPKGYALGLFNLTGHIAGNEKIFKLTNMNAFVGANNFQGTLWVDKSGAKPNIVTELDINRFEPEKFFYNGNAKSGTTVQPNIALRSEAGGERIDFLAKPFWDKERLSYDFYNTFTLTGKFNIGDLVWNGYVFKKAAVSADVRDDKIKIGSFNALLNDRNVMTQAELKLGDKPELQLNFSLEDQDVAGSYWSGELYGLRSGRFNASGKLVLPAASVEDMVLGMSGDVMLDVSRPVVKGWDWLKLAEDLRLRDRSEGLAALAQDSLHSGETVFDSFSGKLSFAKGQVHLTDGKFVSPRVMVTVEDESNLETWDMSAKFSASLPELATVPPFGFSLTGPMNAPELVVDVKPITDVYDAKWAKEAADKQAAEQARAEYLRQLMDEQQQAAQYIKGQLDTEVAAVYNVQSAEAVSEEAKNQYLSIKEELDRTSSGIEEIFTLGLTQEFDETLPQALAKRNEIYAAKVPQLKEQLQATYVGDLKYQINGLYNQVSDIYNKSKEKSNSYRDKFVEFPKRLAKIKTDYNLDTDKLVNQLKQDIESNLLAIDSNNSEMAKAYVAIQNSTDSKALSAFLDKVKAALEDIGKEDKKLDENISRLLDYAAESISLEEDAYQARVKAAEQAKKVQENIGKISASTGVNKTIVRDIEDIEKSEKLKSEEPVKVLDFSKERSSSGMILRKDGSNRPITAAEDGGNLRKASGSISKASGVIVKK